MKATAFLSTFVLSTLALCATSVDARATTCSSGFPCDSVTQSGSGQAIFAIAGSGTAVDAESLDGRGLFATSANNVGAYIANTSSSGSDGIEAVAKASGRSAVFAHNDASNGAYGVFAMANGTGHAIHGLNGSSNGWAGYFEGKVFTTASYQSSDARLKKDIKNVPYGLAQLLELRPVTFQWKKEGAQGGVQLGLIAQEVQKTIPEVVASDAQSGMLSVNYTALLPIVIKGVQEQQKIVREQQQRIQQQEDRISALEHARRPMMSSLFSSDLGQGTVIGVLALAVSSVFRRRSSRGSG